MVDFRVGLRGILGRPLVGVTVAEMTTDGISIINSAVTGSDGFAQLT